MDTRNIIIYSTATHTKKELTSAAETLGELKEELTTANIDYTNMAFHEGKSKTELVTNDSILPRNIPFRGTVTNDLVFMLTPISTKISSGANLNRQQVYATLKELNLQEKCKEEFGKNYTQINTENLQTLIDNYTAQIYKKESNNTTISNNIAASTINYVTDSMLNYVINRLRTDDSLLEAIYTLLIITKADSTENAFKNTACSKETKELDEIESLFDYLK